MVDLVNLRLYHPLSTWESHKKIHRIEEHYINKVKKLKLLFIQRVNRGSVRLIGGIRRWIRLSRISVISHFFPIAASQACSRSFKYLSTVQSLLL